MSAKLGRILVTMLFSSRFVPVSREGCCCPPEAKDNALAKLKLDPERCMDGELVGDGNMV